MSKIACIVQARMGSSRLPGKVLKEVCGKSLLEHLIERLKKAETIDEIVIATSVKPEDRAIIDMADKCGVTSFAGSEEDVLSRYVGAADKTGATDIIRVTSDCPLIDPATLDEVVNHYRAQATDYACNTLERTFPRGLDTEIFTAEALNKADRLASDKPSREHVTLFIYRHPEMFTLSNLYANPPLNRPELRLCVDTEEDFALIKEIYETLYQPGRIIDIKKVMELFDQKPELKKINEHIEQKKV